MVTISTDFIAGVLLGYFLYRSLNGLWKERRREIEEESQRYVAMCISNFKQRQTEMQLKIQHETLKEEKQRISSQTKQGL